MKQKIEVKISEAQEIVLVFPEPETVAALKEWFYVHARRDQYYYDKHVKAYVVDKVLLPRLQETFTIREISERKEEGDAR